MIQIVTTHKNTDFDGLASLIAATVLYPDAVPVLPKTINPNTRAFLSIHKDLFNIHTADEVDPDKVSSLIVVDTNCWERLDRMKNFSQRDDLEIILWDHHSNIGNIHPSWKCQEPMGANITLMVRDFIKERIHLTPIQATLFLAGLYEDTGNLLFPSSTAEDAYAAAYLLECKADLNVLGSLLRPAYGEKQKDVLFQMLKTAKRFKLNGHNVSINRLKIQGHVGGLSVVVHMYREIINVDAAFGIFSDRDNSRCIIIGRSDIDEFNIGRIMKSLGGGGHPGAGSAMLKSVRPGAAEKLLKEIIQGNQQPSVRIGDLMSFPVFTVPSDTPMKDVALILRERGCTGLPVVDDGRLVGIISRRDFRKIKKDTQLAAPVKAFMSTKVIVSDPTQSPMQAARLMVKHDIGRLPVLEKGHLIGIITRSDAMLYFYDQLPE